MSVLPDKDSDSDPQFICRPYVARVTNQKKRKKTHAPSSAQ
jgi:hypothetical protein